ncbi:hypothetical protein AAHE18_05G119800 [Arachis hypogaea]
MASIKEAEFRKSIKQEEKVKEAKIKRNKKQITWRPPPYDWMKINIDESFNRENGVIRNSDSKILSGPTRDFKLDNIRQHEWSFEQSSGSKIPGTELLQLNKR